MTWSAQRAWAEVVGAVAARPHPGTGRAAADGQGPRGGGPDGPRRRRSPTRPSPRCSPCWPTAGPRPGQLDRRELTESRLRRRPRPRHAGAGSRGPCLRDHRGVGRELGQAPCPAGRAAHPARGPGGGGLRCGLRRVPVGHDPHLLCRRPADRRAGQGVRGGGRVPAVGCGPGGAGRDCRIGRPGLPGRPSPPRGGPSASSTAPGTVWASTSTRGHRSARGQLLFSCPAPWSPWNPACTCPGPAGSASRTPWW